VDLDEHRAEQAFAGQAGVANWSGPAYPAVDV
jgi:hypothetical protein